jgi:hypothetical protein
MSLLRRLHAEERGFTLADLMIGALIMMILTGAALSLLDATYRTVGNTSRETRSLDQARLALAQLDHEIRVAASIADANADCPTESCLTLAVPLPGGTIVDVRYTYSAADHIVYRKTGNALLGTWDVQTPVATDVRNVVSLPVFCRAPSACTTPSEKSIAIVLDINATPAKASETVRLSSYATPRNLG